MFNVFSNRVKRYYIEDFRGTLSTTSRPIWCGITLLLAQFCIEIQMILSPGVLQQIKKIDENLNNVLEQFVISTEDKFTLSLLCVILAWNILLILACAFDFLHTQFRILQSTEKKFFTSFLSATNRIYLYILYLPFTWISLSLLTSYRSIALPNLLLTIIIAFILQIHEDDFSFEPKDCLANRLNLLDMSINIAFNLILAISRQSIEQPELMLITPALYACFKVFISVKKSSFDVPVIRSASLFINSTLLVAAIVMYLSVIVTSLISFSVVILCMVVLAIESSKVISYRQRDLRKSDRFLALPTDEILQTDSEEIDFFLRLLLRNIPVDFASSRESEFSVMLENFAVYHYQYCDKFPECYCNPYYFQESNSTKEQRKSKYIYLVKYVRRVFQQYIHASFKKRKSVDIRLCASYLHFLVEVYSNKILSFSEIIRLKGSLNLSLREQSLIFSAFSKANSTFIRKEFAIQLEEKKKSKNLDRNSVTTTAAAAATSRTTLQAKLLAQQQNNNNNNMNRGENHAGEGTLNNELLLNNSNNQNVNASSMYLDEVNVTNYLIGITFDERMAEVENEFYAALSAKSAILSILFSDHIDLVNFREKGMALMDMRERLFIGLSSLTQVNSHSHKLQLFTSNFTTYFGFGQKRRHIFAKSLLLNHTIDKATNPENMLNNNTSKQRRNQLNIHSKQNTRLSAAIEIDPSIFNKNTCVVFVTLIGEVGVIKHTQSSFEYLFGYPSSQVIRKNISMLLPQSLRKPHEDMLIDFHKNPENATRNTFTMLIAQNESGWAIPVTLRFRPDNINLDDCGLTGLLELPRNEFEYIQTSSGSFRIDCVSESLFDSVFEFYFAQSELHRVYLNRIIPLLHILEARAMSPHNAAHFDAHVQKVSDEEENNFDENNNKNSNGDVNLGAEGETITTLAFLPKHEIFRKGFKRFQIFERLAGKDVCEYVSKKLSVEYYELYSVKVRVYPSRLKSVNYNILEFNSFKKIYSYDAQKDALSNFKAQLKYFLGYRLEITKEINLLESLQELHSLHKQLKQYEPATTQQQQQLPNEYHFYNDAYNNGNLYPHEDEQQFQQQQQQQILDSDQLVLQRQFQEELAQAAGLAIVQNDIELMKNSSQQMLAKENSSILLASNLMNNSAIGGAGIGDSKLFDASNAAFNASKFNELNQIMPENAHRQFPVEVPAAQQNYYEIGLYSPTIQSPNSQSTHQLFTGLRPTNAQYIQSTQQLSGLLSPANSQTGQASQQLLGMVSPTNSITQQQQQQQHMQLFGMTSPTSLLFSPTGHQQQLHGMVTSSQSQIMMISPTASALAAAAAAASGSGVRTGTGTGIDSRGMKRSSSISIQNGSTTHVPQNLNQAFFSSSNNSHKKLGQSNLENAKLMHQINENAHQFYSGRNSQAVHTPALSSPTKGTGAGISATAIARGKAHVSQSASAQKNNEISKMFSEYYDQKYKQKSQQKSLSKEQLGHSRNRKAHGTTGIPAGFLKSFRNHPNSLQQQYQSQNSDNIFAKDFAGSSEHTNYNNNNDDSEENELKLADVLKDRVEKARQQLAQFQEQQQEQHHILEEQAILVSPNVNIPNQQNMQEPQEQQHSKVGEFPVNHAEFLATGAPGGVSGPRIIEAAENEAIVVAAVRQANSSERVEKSKREREKNRILLHVENNPVSSAGDVVDSEEDAANEFEREKSRVIGATSSIHTSQSQNQEHKKTIIRMVNSRKRNISLVCLILFQVVALTTFSAIVLMQYMQNISSFNTAQLNFQYLPWPLSQRFVFSRVFSYQMTRDYVRSGFFSSFPDKETYIPEINRQFIQDIEGFKSRAISFFYSNLADTNFFQFTQNTKLNYTLSKDTILLADPSKNVTQFKFLQNISLQYFMLRLIPLFERAQRIGSIDQQITLQDNFMNFINTVGGILTLVSQSVVDIIAQILSQAQTIMVLVIISVVILAFIVIPLNYLIQVKNEEVLKLFATIPSNNLNDMFQPIQFAIASYKGSTRTIKSNPWKTVKKRKTISSTSMLPRVDAAHFIYIFLGIILMIIQPIVSYIYIQSFYTEASVLTDITATLYNTKAYAASIQAVHSSYIVHRLGTGMKIYNPVYYEQRIVTLNKSKQATLEKIYQSVQTSQASSRFEQELYEKFFFRVVSGNVCDAMRDYPEFISSTLSFNVTLCDSVRGGLLKKGFQIGIKEVAESFASLNDFYALTDSEEFKRKFILWESTFNMKDFYDFFDLLTTTIEIMKDFLLSRILNFLSQMKAVFLILLIYQLSMMGFIFYFGYLKFYFSVEQGMFSTKRLLNILSIESVAENPYIISYLTRQE